MSPRITKMKYVSRVIAAAIVIGVGVLLFLAFQPPQPSQARASILGLQADPDTSKFTRALLARDLVFPRDHGPHDDFQTEWWYYTGNVTAASGRHFGYQFTIFRRALAPGAPVSDGSLAARQLYFAHFAVTDTGANTHREFQRFSRGAGGLAGAQADPFRVFIEDWSVEAVASPRRPGLDAASVRIVAKSEGYAIDLTLDSAKPMVRHGDRGLSQKSPEPGNASYYYSYTRMDTRGTMTTPDGSSAVTGQSWMDHEWSTSVLGAGTRGWDWFSLQLSDGSELMYFRLWQADGSDGLSSSGTWVMSNGEIKPLARTDVAITPVDTWRSPANGATYPSGWRIKIASLGVDVVATPRLRDQEMNLSSTYWEGAVSVAGVSGGVTVTGAGFVELTGYAEAMSEKL
jgi:predicted secreted hydrolase